jgi:hypothetical protein
MQKAAFIEDSLLHLKGCKSTPAKEQGTQPFYRVDRCCFLKIAKTTLTRFCIFELSCVDKLIAIGSNTSNMEKPSGGRCECFTGAVPIVSPGSFPVWKKNDQRRAID